MKTAIVTGATSGIGQAAAVGLRTAGFWVLASGRDPARGEEMAGALGDQGAFSGGDLTEPGAPQRLVDEAVERTGRLDVLVNNAGLYVLGTAEETPAEDFDALMEINLRAAVLLTRAAIPAMRAAGGGVIINVSSEAGLVAFPGQMAYNVSKAAMVMLTKSVAVDHAADGIRAVSVCPGTTRTPLVENAIANAADPAALEHRLTSIRPAKRLGTCDEIAKAIVFAAGDDVAYLTGSELVIDGGYTAQ